MTITLELSPQLQAKLEDWSRRKGISIQALASAMLDEALTDRREDFDAILDEIMERNHELYRRLG